MEDPRGEINNSNFYQIPAGGKTAENFRKTPAQNIFKDQRYVKKPQTNERAHRNKIRPLQKSVDTQSLANPSGPGLRNKPISIFEDNQDPHQLSHSQLTKQILHNYPTMAEGMSNARSRDVLGRDGLTSGGSFVMSKLEDLERQKRNLALEENELMK